MNFSTKNGTVNIFYKGEDMKITLVNEDGKEFSLTLDADQAEELIVDLICARNEDEYQKMTRGF